MTQKISNEQVLTELAQLSPTEAEINGVTPGLQAVAAQAANGDPTALATLYTPTTSIYNAFVGFIVKRAVGGLSSATYSDVYSRHHRNMIDGRPVLGFVKPATAGTGNTSKQFDASAPAFGTLTTVSTATQPDVVYLYEESTHAFVARVPISPEDVKTAVITVNGGIEDLIVKTRQAAEDKIIEDRNNIYDDALEDIIDDNRLVAAGSGSESPDNASSATYVTIPATPDEITGLLAGDYGALTDATLTRIYTTIKSVYNGITGRPSEKYNAAGVKNNASADNTFLYIDSDVQAELDTRIASAAYHLDKLEQRGLDMKAIKAPYLSKPVGVTDKYCIAVLGSVDFIRDWATSDFAKTVEVDRGEIYNRFFDCVSAICGYEPCVYIMLDGAALNRWEFVAADNSSYASLIVKPTASESARTLRVDNYSSVLLNNDVSAYTTFTLTPQGPVGVNAFDIEAPDGTIYPFTYTGTTVDILPVVKLSPGVYKITTKVVPA